MNDNYIVIDGIKHVLIPDKNEEECDNCSLQEACEYTSGYLCNDLFNLVYSHFEIQN